jgi:hypothetical protein
MTDTIQIPLVQGGFTVIDADDIGIVSGWRWHNAVFQNGDRYAYASIHGKTTSMHRWLLSNPTMQVDHINGDGFDNRRSNLRLVTPQQNAWNRRLSVRNLSSKFKGVSSAKNGRWNVRVRTESLCFAAQFSTEEHAGRAYDVIAVRLFGEFARLNFAGEIDLSREIVRRVFCRQRVTRRNMDHLIFEDTEAAR